jgi:hypothetical protein
MTVSKQFIRNLFLVFGICLLGYLFFMSLIQPNGKSRSAVVWYPQQCSMAINELIKEKISIENISTCAEVFQQLNGGDSLSSSVKTKIIFSATERTYRIEAEQPKRNSYFPFIIEETWKSNLQFDLP